MMLKRLSRFLFGTLRGRLIVGVAAVHAVMMALLVADLTVRQRALLLERQTEQAVAVSQTLATSAAAWIAAYDVAGMQELVDAQRRYPELLFAMLVDRHGLVLAHSDHSRRGLYLADLPHKASQSLLSRTPKLVDVAVPALVGGRQVGWARVGIGQQAAGEKLARITARGAWYALAAIVVGSLIAWQMGRRITRRLYAVQETINRVRGGDRDARSSLAGDDEAAIMAREFNSVLDQAAQRDAELRASEHKYRSLIQKVQAAIVLHDGSGRIMDSNPMARELLGLSADQILGKELIDPDWRFLREDGSPLPVEEYPASQVLASRRPLRGQVSALARPGADQLLWVLVNAEPEFDEAGEIAQVIVSFIDISERKRSEEALRRLNRELVAISNCNEVLMKASDEQALLSDVCRIVCDKAGYGMVWVGYADNGAAASIRPIAWAVTESGCLAEAQAVWSETGQECGPGANAVRTGQPEFIQDLACGDERAPWRERALQLGFRSSIALPLKDEEQKTFGVFNIYSMQVNAFTPDETRLLEELAGDLAFGVTSLRTRNARREAERSVALLTFALDNVREAAYLIEEPARFRYVNDGACRALGYTREELCTMGVGDVETDFPSEQWQAHWEQLKACRSLTFEGRHRCKDGSTFPVEINANYLEFDGKGYNLALVRDITERRRAEESLKNAAQRLSEAQRLAHIGSWELDIATSTLTWSDEIYRIFEVDPERFGATYQAFLEAVHPEDRDRVNQAYADSLRTKTEYSIDHRLLTPDGRVKHVHEQCRTYFEGDTPIRSLGTVQDVTERKEAEFALLRLNEELDRRVRERTAELEQKNEELERTNRLFVGRELRMIELKERIRELEQVVVQ